MAEFIVAHDWRDIPGFPGYQVSSAGGIRSVTRRIHVERRPGWFVWRTYQGKMLRANTGHHGYLYVVANGRTLCVHHAVLLAFVGPRPDGSYACHADGTRLNNSVDNLRWATPKENSGDAALHGTQVRGERVASAILDEAAVLLVRALGPHCSSREIGALLHVHPVTVRDILNRRTWAHV